MNYFFKDFQGPVATLSNLYTDSPTLVISNIAPCQEVLLLKFGYTARGRLREHHTARSSSINNFIAIYYLLSGKLLC